MRFFAFIVVLIALSALPACKNKPAESVAVMQDQPAGDTLQQQIPGSETVQQPAEEAPIPAREVFKNDPVVKLLNNEEYHNLLLRDSSIVVVDLVTPYEFGLVHIPKAVNIDFQAPDFEQKIGRMNRQKPIAIYCPSGIRSGEAAKKMKAMGFQTIYLLEYGLRSWNWTLEHSVTAPAGAPATEQKGQ